MTTNTAPLLTIDDLTALPYDECNTYELIEGELIASSAPRDTHQEAMGNLFFWIKLYLRDNPVGRVIITPGVILDRHNGVIPDLVFITNEQSARMGSDGHMHEAPALAVEVVSPGRENARRDRVKKLRVYDKFGVGEYWVADPEARNVEVYRRAGDSLALAATLTGEDELDTPLLPGFTCTPARVFGA